MIGLNSFLLLGAALFCIGLFGALSKRNAVAILMGVEIMLNAVNVTLIGFSRFAPWMQRVTPGAGYPTVPTHVGVTTVPPDAYNMIGQVFSIFIITVAAAEAAVALGILVSIYRRRDTVDVADMTAMKG